VATSARASRRAVSIACSASFHRLLEPRLLTVHRPDRLVERDDFRRHPQNPLLALARLSRAAANEDAASAVRSRQVSAPTSPSRAARSASSRSASSCDAPRSPTETRDPIRDLDDEGIVQGLGDVSPMIRDPLATVATVDLEACKTARYHSGSRAAFLTSVLDAGHRDLHRAEDVLPTAKAVAAAASTKSNASAAFSEKLTASPLSRRRTSRAVPAASE